MAVLETKEPLVPEKPEPPLGTTEPGAQPVGTQKPEKPLGVKLFATKPLDPAEILAQGREIMTVRRVFGEPIEKEGVTIVPVAQVMGGFGAGGPAETPSAEGKTGAMAPAEGTRPAPPAGIGGGFGVMARPAGVYVIREGRVRWVPSVDVTRLVFRMILGAAAILWVLRPLLAIRAKAKATTT
jgi:uncharacterized spore protein YtfJ